MPTLSLNGEEIHYERAGEGPPLVLVHSLGTSSALWRDAIAHWQKSRTVIAMDCRGHGRSSNKGGVSIPAIAQDLGALVDRLQLGPIDLLGISMGGLIATHFLTHSPASVRRIVLADTFAAMPEGDKRIGLLRDKLQATDMPTFGKEYAAQTLLPATSAEWHVALAGWVANTSKTAYMQTVESLFTQSVGPLLARFAVPTLVVIGEHDQRTPLVLSREIVGLAPGAKLEIVPDAAHLSNLDNPTGFQAAVDRFFQNN